MKCPRCEPQERIKNGEIHNGKQRDTCKSGHRQCVENPQNGRVSEDMKNIMANGLLEKVSLRGIHRITGVAVSWIPK